MKIFKFLPLACAALMMSACSSDNDIEGGSTNPAGDAQYLAVNIVNVGTTPTRATLPGYADGTAAESKINKIRFYFFHADGSAYGLKNATGGVDNYIEKTTTTTAADGTNTVGAITNTILVIEGTTKQAPASVIAVVNPESITPALGTDAKSLTDLTNNVTGKQFYTIATNDNFAMTNSVYVEAGRTVCPSLVAGHIGTDKTTAEANPVKIYVERVVAKVGADLSTLTANAAGTTKYGMKVGTYSSKDIYAVIDGWGVADENGTANVEKHITNSWKDADLGISTWTTADYHRSFWETSVAFDASNAKVNHNFNDYKAAHDGIVYTLPNTPTTATTNIYNNDLTKFLVTATLKYKDGAGTWHNAEICKYQGVEYLGIDALKEAIATTFNTYYTYDGSDYTPIQASDVTFKTAVAGITVKDYQVIPVLDDSKTYYKKDASSPTGYTALTTENISTYPAEVRKDGKAYYYIPIRHLGAATTDPAYYGVVRNHWYKVKVNSLKGFGTPVYDDTKTIIPTIPDDSNTYLAAQINVLQWRVVEQSVDLGK
ncbi:Mfa1 family fimbria major subunit [Prevotella sp.]|uniref:Mfa1 family fimbria major subunit n=1 Tax=Prevotella sp. TaxID=59823 RepID=UPI0027E2A2D5|nr:Mfa1 family fimbria major subunit [Prevotella sp.]